MTGIRKEYILTLLLTLTQPLMAGRCNIQILNEKNSGEKIRLNFTSTLKSKRQCQALADLHRPNFSPNQVKFKSVDYSWLASPIKTVGNAKKKKSYRIAKEGNKNRRRHSKRF